MHSRIQVFVLSDTGYMGHTQNSNALSDYYPCRRAKDACNNWNTNAVGPKKLSLRETWVLR